MPKPSPSISRPGDLTPDRRQFLEAALVGAPFALGAAASAVPDASRLRVMCIGAHPDDPESGCGGTLTRAAKAGHDVTIVYLTRGERGIEGASLSAAAATRTAEAEQACRVIGATPIFAGQIDGATEVTAAWVERTTGILRDARPDIVFAHWPIDTHLDHQVASLLTFRAWLALGQRFTLCYFEVNAGEQTRVFAPTDYVDISAVADVKRRAVLAHVSQGGEAIMREHHDPMAAFRGREIGVAAAEAFVTAADARQVRRASTQFASQE
jgi:LmbE family N-acetylglucosaminyl deacetylase